VLGSRFAEEGEAGEGFRTYRKHILLEGKSNFFVMNAHPEEVVAGVPECAFA